MIEARETNRGVKRLAAETLWRPPPRMQTMQERGGAIGWKMEKDGVVGRR